MIGTNSPRRGILRIHVNITNRLIQLVHLFVSVADLEIENGNAVFL